MRRYLVMNAEQKRGWLAVVTGFACLAGYLVLAPIIGPYPALGAFGLFGINGFGALIGRNEPKDERDRAIARRATLAGAMCSYTWFVLACMSTWLIVRMGRGQEQVDVHVMGLITALGVGVLFFARGVAVLIYYRRHLEADDA
jgi:hypothetical protein